MAGVCRRALLTSITVPILMFHRVGLISPQQPWITHALTVTPATFAADMTWLKRSGFHAVTMQQLYDALVHGAPLPAKPVAITFDDGYRDVLWNAAPILHRLRMPATDFVVTGRIDAGDPSFLTWPELMRLEALGFAIGSHTVHHVELPYLSPRQAWYELTASRAALERHLGRRADWFSYPSGRYDARVVALVRRAGYLLAVTTQPGDVQSERFGLHRDEILDSTGLKGFEALLGSTGR